MKTSSIIGILAIIIVAVFTIGAFTLFSTQIQAASITNTTTQQGTKLNLKNNNNQAWQHSELEIINTTLKNGTTTNVYIEAWVKPGENVTVDLSNILGYGNTPLPAGTIRIESWKGLYNPTAGGTSNLIDTLQGWSNTNTPGTSDQQYNENYATLLPIAQLPSSITDNTVIIGTSLNDIQNYRGNDANDQLFTEFLVHVDANGKVTITFTIPPTLSYVIARIA
jgi:hypothetical protein